MLDCRRLCLLVAMFMIAVTGVAEGKTYKLYYLGGQSNMDGYGFNKDLPADLKNGVDGVYIFHGNTAKDAEPVNGRGVWSKLQPGHGVGFRFEGTSNKLSNRFGAELTFVHALRKLDPDSHIAIIKYSRGGTSIAIEAARHFGCWDPDYTGGKGLGKGVNQYDHFLATLRNAMKIRDIDGDGEADTLIPAGIVWMQGESDASVSEAIAKRYEANLKRLMDLIRASLRVDDLPVVIGRISDSKNRGKGGLTWPFGEIVRQQQAAFVKNDARAALVTSTDKYGYCDPWHYDSAGFLDLGKEFAKAMHKLESAK